MKTMLEGSNDAKETIEIGCPYQVKVTVEGSSALLFHRWSCDEVEAKSKASKNSKAKKTDNIESYVYRNSDNCICIPGEYFRQSIIHAAKFKQDPRSPRKSAMDLFKAGIVSLTELASLGTKEWDFIDRRRVVIQRNAITRLRPAMLQGWRCSFDIQVLLPEYIEKDLLLDVLTMAGKLCGVGTFRPTFGRFQVVKFEVF